MVIDKRSAIIRAGMALIAQRGFHGAPTAKIAKKAKVAAGSLYLYFKNKDDLIFQIHNEIQNKYNSMAAEWDDEDAPFKERFIRIFHGLYRFSINNKTEFRFLAQFYNSPYDVDLRYQTAPAGKRENSGPEGKNVFEKLFEDGKSRQVVKDLPFHMLMGLIFGPMEFIIRVHYAGLLELGDDLLYTYLNACWDAVKR